MNKPTVDVVTALLELEKQLLRVVEWTDRPSVKVPQWRQFESRCIAGSDETEYLIFRAHYRPNANVVIGDSIVHLPETCYVSLFVGPHRIFGIDSQQGQTHTNKIGYGRPYYKKTLRNPTHMHVWTEAGDGYVEPIEPPLLDLKDIFSEFRTRVNLWLNGDFHHPQRGEQLHLLD